MLAIVPATSDHALELAPRLRAADLAEIEASTGRPIDDVLLDSLSRAVWAETLVLAGRPEAIGGLCTQSLMFGPGIPWMVGSDRLTERARWFLRQSRRQVARMLGFYDSLVNFVDARNAASLRYLRHLGFTLDPAQPWGHAGLPFHRFHMERP